MKNTAFTLAEVLITLGVIGVVATLTLPNLTANYKKKTLITQLKHTYSVLQTGFSLSEVDNGDITEWPFGAEMDVDSFYSQYIEPYFKGVKKCANAASCGYSGTFDTVKWSNDGSHWGVHTDESRVLFRLNSGAVVFFPRNTSDEQGNPSYTRVLYIDVNGGKGPNKGGSDVFSLYRDTANGVIPYPSSSCADNASSGCFQKIVENDWEFPDDYPY